MTEDDRTVQARRFFEQPAFDGAIFDLDGVIVDTAKYHYLAWKCIADDFGFEFTEADNERLKGVSRMRSLDILLEVGGISLSRDEKQEIAEKKNKIYLEYINKLRSSDILPGVREYLSWLGDRGIGRAIGSASRNASIIIDNLKLREYFDVVVDGNKAVRAKPDPQAFLLAAKELGLGPSQCAVFEDSEAGIDAALAAGMYAVGIGPPGSLPKAHITIGDFVGLPGAYS